MAKFKVGDRVMVVEPRRGTYVGDYGQLFFEGQRGVVTEEGCEDDVAVPRVEFDAPTTTRHLSTSWYVPETVLDYEVDTLFSEVVA